MNLYYFFFLCCFLFLCVFMCADAMYMMPSWILFDTPNWPQHIHTYIKMNDFITYTRMCVYYQTRLMCSTVNKITAFQFQLKNIWFSYFSFLASFFLWNCEWIGFRNKECFASADFYFLLFSSELFVIV